MNTTFLDHYNAGFTVLCICSVFFVFHMHTCSWLRKQSHSLGNLQIFPVGGWTLVIIFWCPHADAPGTDIRVATISGNPEACSRAHKMVMDIVAEVNE